MLFCFLVAPIKLFLHPPCEEDVGTYWSEEGSSALQCRERNEVRRQWAGIPKAGITAKIPHLVLPYHTALGNRQRSKRESDDKRLCAPFLPSQSWEVAATSPGAEILCVAAPRETMNGIYDLLFCLFVFPFLFTPPSPPLLTRGSSCAAVSQAVSSQHPSKPMQIPCMESS